jgi:predicted MFS family arabinose efflux permease
MSGPDNEHGPPRATPTIQSATRARPPMQMTLGWVLGAGGVALLVLGVALLAFWEVALFRITTFDHNFTGATCGTPLNNPGWATGSPCHGAVNRQTGAAWLLMTGGLASLVGVVVAAAPFQTRPHRQRARPDRDVHTRSDSPKPSNGTR